MWILCVVFIIVQLQTPMQRTHKLLASKGASFINAVCILLFISMSIKKVTFVRSFRIVHSFYVRNKKKLIPWFVRSVQLDAVPLIISNGLIHTWVLIFNSISVVNLFLYFFSSFWKLIHTRCNNVVYIVTDLLSITSFYFIGPVCTQSSNNQ